jgi:cation:H+ antiporter
MLSFAAFPSGLLAAIFLISAALIAYAGTRMAAIAEKLASYTGLGQAIVGAVFVGISTSLSGTILSFYAAYESHPSLSISNSIGGIAAQTAFLALADMSYRRVNLEHAAASLVNLAQGALLIILLAIPVLISSLPEVSFLSIHPASLILVVAYLGGLRIVEATKSDPMWRPKKTRETQVEPEEESRDPKTLKLLAVQFLFLAVILGSIGLVLADAGVEVAERTGLSETAVGGLFTSVTTSLPELITMFAAIRRGALNLAVGDIIGGNSFDVLFLAGSDIFFREGSIYHQFNESHVMLVSMAILMNAVIMLGMLRREKQGPAGIGFESIIVAGLYIFLAIMLLIL